MMKFSHRVRRRTLLASLLGASLVCLLLATYCASKSVPAFYAEKLKTEPQRSREAGADLETQIIDLHNALHTEGTWTVSVTDEQINGWLAVELDKKFPGFLPYCASNPRIQIEEDGAHVACQYDNGCLSAVLSLALDVFVAEQPNQIGIRIQSARIGSVPGLKAKAVEQMSWAARRARLRLRWLQQEGDPVAMVEIPRAVFDTDNEITVEKLDWRDGQLLLTCTTRSRTTLATDPQSESRGAKRLGRYGANTFRRLTYRQLTAKPSTR